MHGAGTASELENWLFLIKLNVKFKTVKKYKTSIWKFSVLENNFKVTSILNIYSN